jgi:hypothetical protein
VLVTTRHHRPPTRGEGQHASSELRRPALASGHVRLAGQFPRELGTPAFLTWAGEHRLTTARVIRSTSSSGHLVHRRPHAPRRRAVPPGASPESRFGWPDGRWHPAGGLRRASTVARRPWSASRRQASGKHVRPEPRAMPGRAHSDHPGPAGQLAARWGSRICRRARAALGPASMPAWRLPRPRWANWELALDRSVCLRRRRLGGRGASGPGAGAPCTGDSVGDRRGGPCRRQSRAGGPDAGLPRAGGQRERAASPTAWIIPDGQGRPCTGKPPGSGAGKRARGEGVTTELLGTGWCSEAGLGRGGAWPARGCQGPAKLVHPQFGQAGPPGVAGTGG